MIEQWNQLVIGKNQQRIETDGSNSIWWYGLEWSKTSKKKKIEEERFDEQ